VKKRPILSIVQRRSAGFTLIEMIIAIMLTGIIAGMVSVFMVRPIQGYLDTAQRAELSDVADMVLRRLSREARQALPNSIRCGSAAGLCGTTAYNGQDYYFIEFIPVSGGGSYRDEHDGSAGGIPLNFNDTGSCAVTPALCQFDVIGPMPAAPALAIGDFVVVFNFGEVSGISQAPFNAHASNDDCTNCNRARVTNIAGNTVTLNPGAGGGNIFARADGSGRSDSDSTNRFHVVRAGAKNTMYACPANAPGPMVRFENYGFNTNLADAITAATGGTPEVLANEVVCTISYAAQATLQRTGMLTVEMNLRHIAKSSGLQEDITLMRQIHVDNSP
jgi:MSHA biogenesis protein MshO